MLDHFDEWKQYRSMYKPLTAEQVYDKYGPERMKEMWGAFCKDEEYFVDLYTYIDFEVDPTWVSDFIGGTNRVKEFFFDLLWNQVLNNLNDDMMGLDGEQIIRMK